MSKSNIALAIIAGAVIGGIVAIVLKTEAALDDDEESDTDEEDLNESAPRFEKIAKQFSDRISSELKAAEEKLKSAVKRSDNSLHGESGVFL